MANIEITDQGGGTLSDGILQIANGVPLDSTLRNVADQNNTNSPLKLSTTLVQTTSTLQITTNDNPYIDAEDGAGNNRFTIGRATNSQQVNVDFASNPVGSTTIVGGIRTYKDGVNLATTMVFREDGHIGIGETTSPSGLLHVDGGAAIPRMILDADTNVARIFSFRTNDLPRWAFRIDDNETGTNAGSNFAIRRYNDAGTFVAAPISINRATGLTTISEGLNLGGSKLTNFSADQNSGGALTITSANAATYNGTVYNITGAVTISADNTVPDGFSLTIIQQDVNQCTISAGTGLTLRNRQAHTKSAGQWAVISIVRTGSNLILGGDTA